MGGYGRLALSAVVSAPRPLPPRTARPRAGVLLTPMPLWFSLVIVPRPGTLVPPTRTTTPHCVHHARAYLCTAAAATALPVPNGTKAASGGRCNEHPA